MALLCCLVTAGCTPAKISITAVFLDDGHPTAIVHPCGGTHLWRISVVQDPTASASAADPPLRWTVDNGDDRGKHPVNQFRLLKTPPGWALQTESRSLLTIFAVDHTYDVSANIEGPWAGGDVGVEFTLDDLSSLSNGEVWAAPKPFAEPRAMIREEFRRLAAASCR